MSCPTSSYQGHLQNDVVSNWTCFHNGVISHKHISRMSSLTKQVNNLYVTTPIALDIPTHVESGLLLTYAQTTRRLWFGCCSYNFLMSSAVSIPICSLLHVESGSVANTPITMTCRISYSVQTWIHWRVSHTRTTMLSFYVESRFLLHCCVLYCHMMTSHVIYGFI